MEIVKNDSKNTIKYNPNSKYEWTPEDVFQLTGEQFGIVLNALKGILNTPEAAKIFLVKKATDSLENVIVDAVNKGIMKEVIE